MSEDKIKFKQARNFFNALNRDENSIFAKELDEKSNQQEIYFSKNKQEINVLAFMPFV